MRDPGTARVLVLDDEPAAREALRLALEPRHRVRVAASGAEALAALDAEPADVLVLDLALPDGRGEELLARLRREGSELAVVVVTGRGSERSAARALREGACDYLEKPFDVAALRAAVERALVARRAGGHGDPGAFLAVLSASIEAQHPFLAGHSRRTALYAELLAEHLGGSRELQEHVRIAGLAHDVGKLGMPSDLLGRPGSLQGAQRERMERHPKVGARLLAPLRLDPAVAAAVRHHHERWDGGGYPAGLAGEAIPLTARIVALADAWDAMSCDRPYRAALPPGEARREIARCAGRQLDPLLAKEFLALLESAVVEPETLARAVAAAPGWGAS